MEYRNIAEGEIILSGDEWLDLGQWKKSARIGSTVIWGDTYRRPIAPNLKRHKSPEYRLADCIRELMDTGHSVGYAKWSKWEEVILANELLERIYCGEYRPLAGEDIIAHGDECHECGEKWRRSVAIGKTASSQMSGSLIYRRPLKDPPKRQELLKDNLGAMKECVESLLYLGKDEKYPHWEELNSVINARELIASLKGEQA